MAPRLREGLKEAYFAVSPSLLASVSLRCLLALKLLLYVRSFVGMDADTYDRFQGVIDLLTPPRAKRARTCGDGDDATTASSSAATSTDRATLQPQLDPGAALGALIAKKHNAQATGQLNIFLNPKP